MDKKSLAEFARKVLGSKETEGSKREARVPETSKESLQTTSQPRPDVMTGDRTRSNPTAVRPSASSTAAGNGYAKPDRPSDVAREVERRTQEHLQRGQARTNPYVQDVRYRPTPNRPGTQNPIDKVIPRENLEQVAYDVEAAYPQAVARARQMMAAIERLQKREDEVMEKTGASKLAQKTHTYRKDMIEKAEPTVQKYLAGPATALGKKVAEASLSPEQRLAELDMKIANLKSQQAKPDDDYVDELDEGHVSHETKLRGKAPPRGNPTRQ